MLTLLFFSSSNANAWLQKREQVATRGVRLVAEHLQRRPQPRLPPGRRPRPPPSSPTNALNNPSRNISPRSSKNISSLEQKLGSTVFARWERAEAAHQNSLENLPLFAAAVLAGVLAEKYGKTDVGTSTFAGLWLVIRSLYVVLYITTTTIRYSFLRSGAWFAGTVLAIRQFWKSAVALG